MITEEERRAPVVAPRLSHDPEVIVFNLKRRFSGVSATVNALVPLQMQQWQLGYCGNTLPNGVEGMSLGPRPCAYRADRRPAGSSGSGMCAAIRR